MEDEARRRYRASPTHLSTDKSVKLIPLLLALILSELASPQKPEVIYPFFELSRDSTLRHTLASEYLNFPLMQ